MKCHDIICMYIYICIYNIYVTNSATKKTEVPQTDQPWVD